MVYKLNICLLMSSNLFIKLVPIECFRNALSEFYPVNFDQFHKQLFRYVLI